MSGDYKTFAVLTAYGDASHAKRAFRLEKNKKWFRPATEVVAGAPLISSREPTPALDENDYSDASIFDRLVISLDETLVNSRKGWQFGTHESSSDVLLGYRGTRGISRTQYSITVDARFRVWLHDYHSTYGTAVGYNGQNENIIMKRETWILALEPHMHNPFKLVTIRSGAVAIKIEFPNHHEDPDPRYISQLRALLDHGGEAVAEMGCVPPSLNGLGLESAVSTQPVSGAHTPGQSLLYVLTDHLGSGNYGQVFKAIRTRDGETVAMKTFKRPANKRKLDEADATWLIEIRREFRIMKDNPHPNVVHVLEFQETPEPRIVMTYYPDGNIGDCKLNESERLSAMGQVLDGLGHLHANQVVHRDLKPENFLVTMQPLFRVAISDFGFATVVNSGSFLETWCGTPKYMAPEVFPGRHAGYSSAADIWSLGVIGLEWLYGLPGQPDSPRGSAVITDWQWWSTEWSGRLSNRVKDEEADVAINILIHMVDLAANMRWSAHACLQQGLKDGLFTRRAEDGQVVSLTSTLYAYGEVDGSRTPVAARPGQSTRDTLGNDSARDAVPGQNVTANLQHLLNYVNPDCQGLEPEGDSS